MSTLSGHVADYLRLRRALGFKLIREGQVLPQFAAYLDAAGARTITVELAVAWTCLAVGVQPISLAHRLGAVRGFAAYLQTIDPATQVPPRDVLACSASRPVPYLYPEGDIARLIQATRGLRPPLRAATYQVLFGLLAVSGMRVGEALGLRRDDVDLTEGVVTIRQAKFDRARLVPLHPSATDALASYATRRDQLCPQPKTSNFFVSTAGTGLSYGCVRGAGTGRRRPRRPPRREQAPTSVSDGGLAARRGHSAWRERPGT